MSDIPDWLVELAAQQGQEDEADEDEEVAEWDLFRAVPAETSADAADPAPGQFAEPAQQSQVASVVDNETEGDLMAALRSQVDILEPEETPAGARKKNPLDFRFAGLQPWQQLVLAVLVLFDVAVVGLLFLVMLGRVGFP